MISFSKAYPEISCAAEAVHQLIDAMLFKSFCLDPDDIAMGTAMLMAFGAHAGWIQGYILTSSGHSESGLANVRRSVEFTCYAAKVVNNKKRALDWMHHRKDKEARKRFIRECSIPFAYVNDKYSYLRPLLVLYDQSNYYGAHGNFETLIRKYWETKDYDILFSYQDRKETVPMATGLIVLIGYRILQSLEVSLRPSLDRVKLVDLFDYVSQAVRDARLRLAQEEYDGHIPENVLRVIHTDDNSEIDLLFEEYLTREKFR